MDSADRPDMIEARVNIVHPNPRGTNPINKKIADKFGAVLVSGRNSER